MLTCEYLESIISDGGKLKGEIVKKHQEAVKRGEPSGIRGEI